MTNTEFYSCGKGAFLRSVLSELPILLKYHGEECRFIRTGDDKWEYSADDGFHVTFIRERDETHPVIRYYTVFENNGTETVRNFEYTPVYIEIEPSDGHSRIRVSRGCMHYDSVFPTRAFHIEDYAFMIHDHNRPVEIGCNCARDWSPLMQYAVSSKTKSGFFVLPQWSAGWTLRGGYKNSSFNGERDDPFLVSGTLNTEVNEIKPGQKVTMPTIHLVFFDERQWDDTGNILRNYLYDISAKYRGERILPVTYDHWFGIYGDFDINYMMAQAKRAAELGCEFFCLDAMWYKVAGDGLGTGNWDQPDPAKFPNGKADIKKLADHVRELGMGFGMWHLVQLASADSSARIMHPNAFDEVMLRLDREEGYKYALDTISGLVEDFGLTWTRFECLAHDGIEYNEAFDRLVAELRNKYPNLYIEICSGGAQRLDINSVMHTNGTWLSDHTSSPECCRMSQSGAIRFWPVHFTNMAVTAFRGRASKTATVYECISRMVGVLSFNGAISEWSENESAEMKKCVDIYKATRHLKNQPVFFPLGQPQNIDEWESIVYGDGSGEAQLMFVFRAEGKDTVSFDVRGGESGGKWELLLSSADAGLKENENGVAITMPEYSGALWIKRK